MTALPNNRNRITIGTDRRPDYAAGLRALADLIEADPTVPIPSGAEAALFLHGDNAKDVARDLLRTIGGSWNKKESTTGERLIFEGWLHGLPVDVWVHREAVCERVVKGSREVTELLPVGEDKRPVKAVTRTEDIVEWICSPLLADETQAVQS